MPAPIEIVDYDPRWPQRFAELREVLAAALGPLAPAIEHIGSTSVPGLAAKPIVDVDVVIADYEALPAVIDALARLGYRHKGERGVEGREAFDWGEHPQHAVPLDGSGRRWMEHHLYVCPRGSYGLRRHLALRDWLRSHPDDRDAYAALKRELALELGNDRPGYSRAKSGLIEALLTSALGEGFCTARAVVRPFARDDLELAFAVFSDPEVMRHYAEGPDPDRASTKARIARYMAIEATHGFSKGAVFERSRGAYLGDAGLTVLAETGEVELGYRIARTHWGRGLATEVGEAWLARAFGELGLERVIAFADHRNHASIRVMDKLGMRFTRRDRLCGLDAVVYEVTRRSG